MKLETAKIKAETALRQAETELVLLISLGRQIYKQTGQTDRQIDGNKSIDNPKEKSMHQNLTHRHRQSPQRPSCYLRKQKLRTI
jgi:hypothetical protein